MTLTSRPLFPPTSSDISTLIVSIPLSGLLFAFRLLSTTGYGGAFYGRDRLALIFAPPMALIFGVSALFAVRTVRGRVRDFSLLGHLALAWPVVALPILALFGLFGLCVVPLNLPLALVAVIRVAVTHRNDGDLLAIFGAIAFDIFAWVFAGAWFDVFGD